MEKAQELKRDNNPLYINFQNMADNFERWQNFDATNSFAEYKECIIYKETDAELKQNKYLPSREIKNKWRKKN